MDGQGLRSREGWVVLWCRDRPTTDDLAATEDTRVPRLARCSNIHVKFVHNGGVHAMSPKAES